ncbi:amidohydrolase [Lysobacter pythonis]|uniref:Amidohydrolase n=1 Tax=Solilutibacter pythonis TaxID=2483112 RepID=A0A3M2I407_9GAMM|nr:amidohydrolase family protein [Lysobacter pythonis]RMH93217.1 amidohydrolase [Lysobacter pythonis]
MNRHPMKSTLAAGLLAVAGAAPAQDMLIRNATVHTASGQGTLKNADVLVRNGRIAALGRGLGAGGAPVIEAEGRPLTPALFAGITDIGVEEVSGESKTVDSQVALGQNGKDMQVRPEFDVTLAYNPESVLIPVARVEGFGWTMLAANPTSGGAFIGGQGGAFRFDGSLDPIGQRMLFVTLGADGARLTGGSRAAQWMILDQLLDEVRGRIAPDSRFALLTPAGRATLARYFDGEGRIALGVHRAADIRRALRWAKSRNAKIALVGASEAWKAASEIAAARVPVFIDPLANLPADFDQIAATQENAARLRAAGVEVAFSLSDSASHYARKQRQLAGNAVAHGMAWDDALAALTRVPAEALGLAAEVGTIAPGRRADLVLWSGDPLDVAETARQVWMGGRAVPMTSRQTQLRERYLHRGETTLPPAYSR